MGFVKNAFDSITGKSAAEKASKAQQGASDASIAEQRRQFDAYKKLLEPFVNAGNQSLTGQQDILGLNGTDAQKQAIAAIENSPFFQNQYKQAENAILQNAAATGGLRGGNIQEALADNRANMLYGNVANQNQNLGQLTALGQNAAAGTGNAGMTMANNVSAGLNDIGQAQAGYQLAKGQINRGLLGGVLNIGAGMMGFGGF